MATYVATERTARDMLPDAADITFKTKRLVWSLGVGLLAFAVVLVLDPRSLIGWVGCAVIVLMPVLMISLLGRTLRSEFPAGTEVRVAADASGLQLIGPRGRSEHPWGAFTDVAVRQHVVGLRMKPSRSYVLLPRAAFTPEELDVVLAQATR